MGRRAASRAGAEERDVDPQQDSAGGVGDGAAAGELRRQSQRQHLRRAELRAHDRRWGHCHWDPPDVRTR